MHKHMETRKEQIAQLEAMYEQMFSEIDKRREYRMQNYYNGVDDYSYGGICDMADNALENRLRAELEIKIEQVMNDGKVIRESSFYRLVSGNGQCNGVVQGRYGACFIIGGNFVGVPKKISTLTKKGYKLFHVARTYECTLKEVCQYGARWQTMKMLNETITEVVDNMPKYIGELSYMDYQYETYFSIKK